MTHGWILVQAEAGQPATFLNIVTDHERMYPSIISHTQLRKYVWACLVNENNCARRLGHYIVGFSQSSLLAGGSEPKPMVPIISTVYYDST